MNDSFHNQRRKPMDTQLIISLILIVTLLEVFAVILFVKYRRGDIESNPFLTLLQKEWLLVFYAFFRWKKKHVQTKEIRTYAYHKGSNYF
jgi:hypothetical protein